MKYIVDAPEGRLDDLTEAVRAISPEAGDPIPVGMDEEHHVMKLSVASWWYEDEIRKSWEDRQLTPWRELSEDSREAMAGFLSGFIGVQFEGFNSDGVQECLDGFLREHPGFIPTPEAAK